MRATPISLWDESAIEQDFAAEFSGEETAEIAIIGGGFTGLSTALHSSNLGHKCIVLEANHIGYGGSGRAVGLVNAGLWLAPQDVRMRLGDTKGPALVQLLSDAPDYVFSLIEEYQIQCEATRAGTIHAAHSPAGFKNLKRRFDEWKRLGAPVELLSRIEASQEIGSKAFYGGLLDHRAGTINPMGYVRGLARAARSAGARVFTNARVETLRRAGNEWLLKTPGGIVTAGQVVIATESYSDALWPGLSKTLTPIHFFQFATEPLGERGMHILRYGQGLWDTSPIIFSMRRDASGRLIIGTMGRVIGGMNGLSKRWAERRVRGLFPELGPVRFEKAWHGTMGMTSNHIPRIHRLAEGLYAPIGYNGRGITPGTMFGKAMAELLSGGQEDTLPLPVTDLRRERNRTVIAHLYEVAFTANQLVKSI